MPSSMSEVAFHSSTSTEQSQISGVSIEVFEVENLRNLQPCCMQFSPRSPNHLVVGTYLLEDAATQSRAGALLLYFVLEGKLVILDEYTHSAGILDIQFNNPKCQSEELFAIASSNGSISIFKLAESLINDIVVLFIVPLKTFEIFPESVLVLSLAWHSSPNGQIAVSLSNGKVHTLDFNEDYTVLYKNTHIYNHGNDNVWTVAFAMDHGHLFAGESVYNSMKDHSQDHLHGDPRTSATTKHGIYSGGDDSRLRFAEVNGNGVTRIANDRFEDAEDGIAIDDGAEIVDYNISTEHARPRDFGGHNAGVTAILPFPFKTAIGQDILLTGSFDDHVRVYAMYDHRSYAIDKKPKVLAELNLGGGVWRLRFMEDYTKSDPGQDRDDEYTTRETEPTLYRILASCMQAGAFILEVTGCLRGEWMIKAAAQMKNIGASDLIYAGDVQPALPEDPDRLTDVDKRKYVCVAANFYEKHLRVWTYTPSSGSS